MSILGRIQRRDLNDSLRKEDSFFARISKIDEFVDNNEKAEPIKDILGSVHCHKELEPLVKVCYGRDWIPFLLFSSERKTYESKSKKYGKGGDNTEWSQYPVLGEYNPEDKCITLFYYNILDCAKKDDVDVLIVIRFVYLHELMHKYFDREKDHKYVFEIEEPLAEFGALYCLDLLVANGAADKAELDRAIKSVESKDGPIESYSYGATLYKGFKTSPEALKDFLINYR